MAPVLDLDRHATLAWKTYENRDAASDIGSDASPLRLHVARPRPVPDNKGCILLVDDDFFIRETMAELLDDVGFTVLVAANAADARAILHQPGVIDVLVTDLTMPGDDGIALIRQARAIRSDLPAILLTGYAEQVTSMTTNAGGNFHVLRKPVESERLIQQLELLAAKPRN